MLAHRLRRWSNIKKTLFQRLVFDVKAPLENPSVVVSANDDYQIHIIRHKVGE